MFSQEITREITASIIKRANKENLNSLKSSEISRFYWLMNRKLRNSSELRLAPTIRFNRPFLTANYFDMRFSFSPYHTQAVNINSNEIMLNIEKSGFSHDLNSTMKSKYSEIIYWRR